jgi:hypothetical protein
MIVECNSLSNEETATPGAPRSDPQRIDVLVGCLADGVAHCPQAFAAVRKGRIDRCMLLLNTPGYGEKCFVFASIVGKLLSCPASSSPPDKDWSRPSDDTFLDTSVPPLMQLVL